MSEQIDEAMQLVVEIAAMTPIEYHQGDPVCFFCGAQEEAAEDSSVSLVHIPFCVWLRAEALARPWLQDLKCPAEK